MIIKILIINTYYKSKLSRIIEFHFKISSEYNQSYLNCTDANDHFNDHIF